jgi:hypothetical protein
MLLGQGGKLLEQGIADGYLVHRDKIGIARDIASQGSVEINAANKQSTLGFSGSKRRCSMGTLPSRPMRSGSHKA